MDKYKILLHSQDNKILLRDNAKGFKDLPEITQREYLKLRRDNSEAVLDVLGVQGDHLIKPQGIVCYAAAVDLTAHILTLRIMRYSDHIIFNECGVMLNPQFYTEEQINRRTLGASVVDEHLPDFIEHLI